MKLKYLLFLLATLLVTACSTETTPEAPVLDATQQLGQAVYKLRCAQCHALTPDTIVIGPSMAGIATRAGNQVAGYSAEEYIETSILNPKKYLVEGFTDTMPTNFGKDLTSEELTAVIAYLMTLK
jgi:cytochrome c2